MSIERLSVLLQQLATKAKQADIKNASTKAHRLIENTNLFSADLFISQSNCFTPYIEEVQKKLASFSRLEKAGKIELSKQLIRQIEQQVSAISNALHSNSVLHQAAKLSFDAYHKVKNKKIRSEANYKNITKKLVLNSQQLYQKLNEHHEFERRLMEMLAERELQRVKCRLNDNSTLTAEVLALHQRLGRCRQAISVIEKDIESAEKRS